MLAPLPQLMLAPRQPYTCTFMVASTQAQCHKLALCPCMLGLGPCGCRVALQTNSCCTMPVSATLGRACDVEWAAHARHVARAPKPKRPVVTGVAMPGHRHTRRGCFCTKGSSLNDRGAGDPIRRFIYASGRSRSGTWSHHRHTESCKPNKTKQNKTAGDASCWTAA